MTMYSKAMEIIALERPSSSLSNYTDTGLISAWALPRVQKTVGAGIFRGKTENTINPKENLTHAESITAIRNLLTQAGLIG